MVKIDGYGDKLTVDGVCIGELSPAEHAKIENEKVCLGPQKKLYNYFTREFENQIPNDFKNEFFNSYE